MIETWIHSAWNEMALSHIHTTDSANMYKKICYNNKKKKPTTRVTFAYSAYHIISKVPKLFAMAGHFKYFRPSLES